MAIIRDEDIRNIIPLWRSYVETAREGELTYVGGQNRALGFDRFKEFETAWKSHPSIVTAADLINIAVVSDNKQLDEVIRAAEYMCMNSDICSPLALDVARSIVSRPHHSICNDPDINIPGFENLASSLMKELEDQVVKTKARIGQLKRQLREFCYNAIAYCELARCYSDLGIKEKAEFYMKCAVQLAPHNRYISRCAARFFVHINDPGRARRILLFNQGVKRDPWLLASEIAVSSVMNRTSRYIKPGREIVLSGSVSPFSSSELCFAICKEDYDAGKSKDWQSMFNLGLRAPNENSLAQAEFIARDEARMRFDYGLFDSLRHKNEADTRNYYSLDKYEEAFISSLKWMHDYRFSHEPTAFASDISCTFLKQYNYSAEIIKRWLESHPQDYPMMNNLVYVLALSGKVDEAEKLLSRINLKQSFTENTDNGICLIATQGLIQYRKNNIEEGRALYQLSIDTAKRLRKKELAGKARLNMIREEIHCVDNYDPGLLNELDSLSTGFDKETEQLKKDIRLEAEKKTKNQ